jgi:hypothetical protein
MLYYWKKDYLTSTRSGCRRAAKAELHNYFHSEFTEQSRIPGRNPRLSSKMAVHAMHALDHCLTARANSSGQPFEADCMFNVAQRSVI